MTTAEKKETGGVLHGYQGLQNLLCLLFATSVLKKTIDVWHEDGFMFFIPTNLLERKNMSRLVQKTVAVFVCVLALFGTKRKNSVAVSNTVFSLLALALHALLFVLKTKIIFIDTVFGLWTLSVFLKLYSYNSYCNTHGHSSPGHFLYFMACPSLVFKPEYKRTEHRQKKAILKNLVGCLFFSLVVYLELAKELPPKIQTALGHRREGRTLLLVSSIIGIGHSSAVVWLAGFKLFFDQFLSLVAEIEMFHHREFYHDWWNSHTVEVYWRRWNLPVHLWLKHHLYIPLRKRYSRPVSSAIVFCVSAISHEVVAGAGCGFFTGIVFLGMVAQPLLGAVVLESTRPHNSAVFSNCLLWTSVCFLFTPLILLSYGERLGSQTDRVNQSLAGRGTM
ncbi:MAG: sterol O-acyltransferase [Amphiamblys sp. WSBS2006]|nr:MAG: sterol O-acyltransferase [Amphiamblys sp. WSBS2006]